MAHQQQFLQSPWFVPPQQNQLFPADYQEFAKATALRNSLNLAIPVRLANSTVAEYTNSFTVVRSLIKRFDVEGKLVTVAENVRKWMEEDNPDWLVKICRRVAGDTKDGKAAYLVLYGDGFETLVLLDGIEPPKDLSFVQTIGISVSFAPAVDEIDQETAARQGLLEPSDSLWEHILFELNRQGNDRSLVLHTTSRVSAVRSVEDSHRKRVIQLWTLGTNKCTLGRLNRDIKLENQWKLGWLGSAAKAKMPAAQEPGRALARQALAKKIPASAVALPSPSKTAPTLVATSTLLPPSNKVAAIDDAIDPEPIVLTFNPREIMVLERAFEDCLTAADVAMDCEVWGHEDYEAASALCDSAGLRWTGSMDERKRKGGDVDDPQAVKKHRGRPKGSKNKALKTTGEETSKKTTGEESPKKTTGEESPKKTTGEEPSKKTTGEEPSKKTNDSAQASTTESKPAQATEELESGNSPVKVSRTNDPEQPNGVTTQSNENDKSKETMNSKENDKSKEATKSKESEKPKELAKSKTIEKSKDATKAKRESTKAKATEKAKESAKAKEAEKPRESAKSKASEKAKGTSKVKEEENTSLEEPKEVHEMVPPEESKSKVTSLEERLDENASKKKDDDMSKMDKEPEDSTKKSPLRPKSSRSKSKDDKTKSPTKPREAKNKSKAQGKASGKKGK